MTGAEYLNFLIGTSTRQGMLDKNPDDTDYRGFMLECLNLVVKDIQNRQQSWHWRFLENTSTAPTVAGQIDYDVSSLSPAIDTNKIIAVFDRTNDRTYKFIPHHKFVKLFPDPSNDSGNPTTYTFWANVIKLYPVPASVFTFYVRYISLITELADDANSNEIPAKYDQVVIDGALTWAYRLDPELGNITTQQQLYEGGVSRMIKDNRNMPDEISRSCSHRGGMRPVVHGMNSLLFPLEGF